MNIIERIDRPCEYVEVAQTALIACQYLYLWLFAGPDDAYKVYSLAILMAFEFVMVHSGLFMAAMPLKASIRLFIPLYGLFAFAAGSQTIDDCLGRLFCVDGIGGMCRICHSFFQLRNSFFRIGILYPWSTCRRIVCWKALCTNMSRISVLQCTFFF